MLKVFQFACFVSSTWPPLAALLPVIAGASEVYAPISVAASSVLGLISVEYIFLSRVRHAHGGGFAGSLAPHTSGPRDVPRCGALSLLQKTLHYRGDPAETAVG
jgi:hypothetical protein